MLILLVLLLLLAAPARAQEEPPACTPEWEGMTACFAEKLCLCRFQPGGQLTGRPSGHRWDCGVLRPHCGVAPAGPPPSPVVPGYGGYPAPYGSEQEGSYPSAHSRPVPGRIPALR